MSLAESTVTVFWIVLAFTWSKVARSAFDSGTAATGAAAGVAEPAAFGGGICASAVNERDRIAVAVCARAKTRRFEVIQGSMKLVWMCIGTTFIRFLAANVAATP